MKREEAARELNAVSISRRGLMMATAGLAVAGAGFSHAGFSGSPYDPRLSAEGQVKVNATLDGSPAFWSYSGVIYAVRPHLRPLPILATTGCQTNWAARQADNSFLTAGPLLNYFRSVDTGAFLEHFDNPFTGKRDDVHPNVFSGKGRALYPADGSSVRLVSDIGTAESAPEGFKRTDSQRALGRVSWSLTADSVVLNTDSFFDVQTQPQGEAQTRTADRAQFFDPRIQRVRARFSATTMSPWLAWMRMGDVDGHLVWHTYGEKVFAVRELPEDYRARAGKLLDEVVARPDL